MFGVIPVLQVSENFSCLPHRFHFWELSLLPFKAGNNISQSLVMPLASCRQPGDSAGSHSLEDLLVLSRTPGDPQILSGHPWGQNCVLTYPKTSCVWSCFPVVAVMRDGVIALMADRIGACVILCFKHVTVLILNAVNINRYNPQTHRLRVLDDF